MCVIFLGHFGGHSGVIVIPLFQFKRNGVTVLWFTLSPSALTGHSGWGGQCRNAGGKCSTG